MRHIKGISVKAILELIKFITYHSSISFCNYVHKNQKKNKYQDDSQ